MDGWLPTSYYYPGAKLSGYNWRKNVVYELLNNYLYSIEDVQKLLGKNAYRVLKEIFVGTELFPKIR
ncbi:MAG: hypothetical protein ACI9JN_002341 [Bacteroidia bacterium]|jgi:hypothetical protein